MNKLADPYHIKNDLSKLTEVNRRFNMYYNETNNFIFFCINHHILDYYY